MGLCGSETVKSIDELTKILVEMNICNSCNAKQFIEKLYEYDGSNKSKRLEYGGTSPMDINRFIYFKKVIDKNKKEYCKISANWDASGGFPMFDN